jgi:hypothetical protein
MPLAEVSLFRIEKARTDAVVTLANGTSVAGQVFVTQSSPISLGPERVVELLNSEPGFFPFEVQEQGRPKTVLLNRDHVLTVAVSGNEAQRESGYARATTRAVSLLLSDGRQLRGAIRIYRPQGRDRLSDWARHGERFRYIETGDTTLIVNADHIIEASEVSER